MPLNLRIMAVTTLTDAMANYVKFARERMPKLKIPSNARHEFLSALRQSNPNFIILETIKETFIVGMNMRNITMEQIKVQLFEFIYERGVDEESTEQEMFGCMLDHKDELLELGIYVDLEH